jgi:DNA-binding transcriptional LysR family regulator
VSSGGSPSSRGSSAAAKDLRLSTAAVSKLVAALEERVGARLLHRTTRRVTRTSAGEVYYERCVRILDDLDEAEEALGAGARATRGLVRVSAPMSFGLLHVSPLVPEILARWPELRLEVAFDDRFVDLVDGSFDLAIRIATELPGSATLTAQKLAHARRVVCASPRYLEARGTPRTPGELAEHECIVYALATAGDAWTLRGPGGETTVWVAGRLVLGNSIAIRDAALAGLGIALLPAFYVEPQLRSGALREVLPDHAPVPLVVHAVHEKSRQTPARVRAVVSFLRERFSVAEWAS